MKFSVLYSYDKIQYSCHQWPRAMMSTIFLSPVAAVYEEIQYSCHQWPQANGTPPCYSCKFRPRNLIFLIMLGGVSIVGALITLSTGSQSLNRLPFFWYLFAITIWRKRVSFCYVCLLVSGLVSGSIVVCLSFYHAADVLVFPFCWTWRLVFCW